MKKFPYYLLIVFTLTLLSCSNESIEDLTSEEVETPDPDADTDTDTDVDPDLSTSPCDFSLEGLASNSSVTIDCVMDLEGKTITLPANVNLDFDGGSIINGTLVFAGGTIDGRLLNSELTIEGSTRLKDPIFKFTPSRWHNIKQGQTTSDIALQNTANLEDLMFFTKSLGATTFEIGTFDAYFETTKVTSTTTNQNFYASIEAINVPGDFHLKMGSGTVLRQYPAEGGVENGTILAVRDVANVRISGGTLMGDRDLRTYSANDVGLEGTHLLHIHSGRNITVDGVNFENGSKGAIHIHSLGFAFNPDYNPTTGVDIINSTFKNIRRMGMAITDGRDVLVENNKFINIGQPSNASDGGEVGYAINVEAVRRRDAAGNLVEYERAFDIMIRGNEETNSRVGFVSVHVGQQVTVEDNNVGTRVVYSLTNGTKILNNRFNASSSDEEFAIFAAGGLSETVYDNEVANNTITGYGLGIATNTQDTYVHGNTISNCNMGIQITKTMNSRFVNNTIDVANNGISGVSTFADNVEFSNNNITAQGFHVKLSLINQKPEESGYRITFRGNSFLNEKQVNFYQTNGINFTENEVVGGIEIGDASNITVSANTKIEPNSSDGIRIYGSHDAITISDNNILEPTGGTRFNCINNSSSTPSAITLSNNSCNQR